MLTLDKVYHAKYVLKPVIRETDVIHAPKINPEAQIFLKTENLQIMRSSYPILDEEAKRVISKLSFIPGMHDGKKVKVYMTIPVNFKLR